MGSEKMCLDAEKGEAAERAATEGAIDSKGDWDEYGEQEQPTWEDFADKIDENFQRKKPSPEKRERMDRRLVELGQLFEGSGVHWCLDGALNISLMCGAGEDSEKYIGEHKDVDISVEKDELEALETQFRTKGYGLFLSHTKNTGANKVMKRVGFRDFGDATEGDRFIAAIDDRGKIRRDKELSLIDVHIVKRDEAGTPLGVAGAPIPEQWAESQTQEFHGTQLHISHPAKVLYFKLHQGRNYDKTDVIHLIEIGKITESDIDDIERVYESELALTIERGRKIFASCCDQITAEMHADEIFAVLQQQPEFHARADLTGGLRRLAERIAESPKRSLEDILALAIDQFGVREQYEKKRQELLGLKRRTQAVQEIHRLRSELT